MKIMHLIGGGDVGGAKTHVLSLVERLNAVLDDVLLIALRDGEFADEARAMGIPVEVVHTGSPLGDVRRLAVLVAEHGFDVIHTHGAKANLFGAILRCRCKCPVVSTVHSDPKLDYLGNKLKQYTNGALNALALRRLDAYIGVTDRFADMLIGRGFDPYHVHVIYNGLDFSYEPTPTVSREAYLQSVGLAMEPTDVICGIAARFHPVKDIGTILRAFGLLRETCPGLKLVIGGDGEQKAYLEGLVREYHLEDRVAFAGWVRNMDDFLEAIDINLLSSLSESFPYSVLEAIRAKCTMVTTAVGGMPVLIDHGANGLLFTPQDAETLAAHLRYLYENPAVRQEMADKLLEKARARYSLDQMVRVQCEIYKRVRHTYEVERKPLARVTICGSYGRGNAGDDAILKALTAELHEASPDARLCVLSRDPKETRVKYRVYSRYTFNPFAMFYEFRRSKLFVNGGGSLIQDSTSSRSLYFYLFTIRSAHLLGTPVMMYGCGIGPVTHPFNRRHAARVIDRAVDTVTLREPGSLAELRDMGVTRPRLILAADPTLGLAPGEESVIQSALFSEGIGEDEPCAAFALRNWHGFSEKLPAFARAVDEIATRYGLTPVLVPMEFDRDLPIAEAVAAAMQTKAKIIRGRHDVFAVIGILSRMKLIVAMRLHALVFGAGQGVPVVGIAYDNKVTRFMDYIGRELCIPYEEADCDRILACVDAALKDPGTRERLTTATERIRVAERENQSAAKEILDRE